MAVFGPKSLILAGFPLSNGSNSRNSSHWAPSRLRRPPRGTEKEAAVFTADELGGFFDESAYRFNRSAGGKAEVGGIIDNKDFRLILKRPLGRSPSGLPPKGADLTFSPGFAR